jgi:hypothetical protein
MGWDYQTTGLDTESLVRKSMAEGGYTVVKYHRAGGASYVAFQQPNNGPTTAVVVLVNRRGGQVGMKWIHETEGPFYHDAPADFLDSLSPLGRGYSEVWRERCRAKATA